MNKFYAENKKTIIIFLVTLIATVACGALLSLQNKKQPATLSGRDDSAAAASAAQPIQRQTLLQKNYDEDGSPNSAALPSILPLLNQNNAPPNTASPAGVTLEKHILAVDQKQYEISIAASSTVFDLMNALKTRGDLDFKGKNSSEMGFFMEEIKGVKNNPRENKYWIYYINDKAASIGISSYILKPGDIITWKYENSPF